MRVARTLPMRFGPYLLTELLGTGGMAAVYRARRRGASGFETSVVVKMVLPEHRRNQRYMRMFKEEAQLSAQLQHANVVRVHDFGVLYGVPFLEMEELTGWNLHELWSALAERGARMPVPIALALVSEACRGLAYAHSFVDDAGVHRPIIHRDVSPANVMICRDGAVKLVDFGLARLTRGETLEIDTFLGKLAYMSPEQLERHQLDRRADVFALGVTLYELITGQRLFAGANNIETLQRLQKLVIDPPSRLNPSAPAALDVVILRALHRDPDQRYPSAAELSAALDKLACITATRAQLLAYLGGIAPDVFTRACDGCGGRVAWGADCGECKTRVEAAPFAGAAAFADDGAPPPSELGAELVELAAIEASLGWRARIGGWLAHRRLVVRLTLALMWRRADAWLAERRIRAIERRAG